MSQTETTSRSPSALSTVMKTLFHFYFQPLVLLLSSLTLALTATVPTTSTLTEFLIPSNQTLFSQEHNLRCVATVPYSPFFLQQHVCEQAILQLNDNLTLGIFHHGDPDDGFSLPVNRIVGNCRVTIDMSNRGLYETSSWSQINHKASQLNRICGGKHKYRYCGGTLTTGATDNIRITLDRLMPFAKGPKNETYMATDE